MDRTVTWCAWQNWTELNACFFSILVLSSVLTFVCFVFCWFMCPIPWSSNWSSRSQISVWEVNEAHSGSCFEMLEHSWKNEPDCGGRALRADLSYLQTSQTSSFSERGKRGSSPFPAEMKPMIVLINLILLLKDKRTLDCPGQENWAPLFFLNTESAASSSEEAPETLSSDLAHYCISLPVLFRSCSLEAKAKQMEGVQDFCTVQYNNCNYSINESHAHSFSVTAFSAPGSQGPRIWICKMNVHYMLYVCVQALLKINK